MIPSIDYFTLVVAGALLVAFDRLTEPDGRPTQLVLDACFWIGCVLFVVGAARAFLGANGL